MAAQLLYEALEVLVALPPQECSALTARPDTRAFGLRDLKRPRGIVQLKPHVEIINLVTLLP